MTAGDFRARIAELEAENTALRGFIAAVGDVARAPRPATWRDGGTDKMLSAQRSIGMQIAAVCQLLAASRHMDPAGAASELRASTADVIDYETEDQAHAAAAAQSESRQPGGSLDRCADLIGRINDGGSDVVPIRPGIQTHG